MSSGLGGFEGGQGFKEVVGVVNHAVRAEFVGRDGCVAIAHENAGNAGRGGGFAVGLAVADQGGASGSHLQTVEHGQKMGGIGLLDP